MSDVDKFPHPGLDDDPCAASPCLQGADLIVNIRLQPALEAGAVGGQLLEVPLCLEHAQHLRYGAEVIDIETGLAR